MKIELQISKVTVLTNRTNTDLVRLTVDNFSNPMPYLKTHKAVFEISVASGEGIKWCMDNLGVSKEDIEVIKW